MGLVTFGRRRALLAVALTAALILGATSNGARAAGEASPPPAPAFADLIAAPWAQASVVRLALNGIVRGYADGTFQPGLPVTRAELATFVVRALGLEAEAEAKAATALPFIDFLGIPAWARGHIAVATGKGFMAGVPTQSGPAFLPDAPAIRSQVVVTVVRALGKESEAMSLAQSELKLADAVQVPAWARGHVALALDTGLVSGYPDGTFRPDQPVTRAELAILLERLAERTQRFAADVQGILRTVELQGDGETLLRVTPGAGPERAITVKLGTPAFLDRRPAAVSGLIGGQRVVVQVAPGDQALLVLAERLQILPGPIGGGGSPGPSPGPTPSPSPTPGGPFPAFPGTGTVVPAGPLAFTLTVPPIVPRGLPIELSFQAANTSAAPVLVTFVSGQHFDFRLLGPSQWTWSNNQFFAQSANTMSWAPGETRTFAVTWPQVDLQNGPARAGSYTAEAWFLGEYAGTAWGRAPVASVTFRLP